MSASKTTKHDVSTVVGFLAEFDAQAAALSKAHRWCSVGYAYSATGRTDDERAYVIPEPDSRNSDPRFAGVTLPDEYLSDAGRAHFAGQAAETLAQLRRGVVAALRYGKIHGKVTLEEARAACAALGIPAPTSETGYSAEFAWDNRSPRVLMAGKPSSEQRDAIRAAILAGFRQVTMPDGITLDTSDTAIYLGSFYQNDAWTFPVE